MRKHPVESIYQGLGHLLTHALGVAEHTSEPCTCCQRPAVEFGNNVYVGRDSYNQPYRHCAACQSFFITDIAVMGVERLARGTPVGQKLGMWKGVGFVHEVPTGRSVLLAPPGVVAKLPESFQQQVEIATMTVAGHIPYLAQQHFQYPLLYVEEFGVKTYAFIRGLAFSHSAKQLICCNDSGINATNRTLSTIDLEAVLAFTKAYDALEKTAKTNLLTVIQGLSSGRLSPKEATAATKKTPEVLPIIRSLPADPHQRLAMTRLVKKLAA